MNSFFGILFLVLVSLAPAKSSVDDQLFESKFWIWHDALQVQLTDRETNASVIIYMEYDAYKKNYITYYDINFFAKKGQPIPLSLLQFHDIEMVRKIASFTSFETSTHNLINSTIRPKPKATEENPLDPSYVFLPNFGGHSDFLGDPKNDGHALLKYQVKRILDRVLHHPKGVLVHSGIGVCSQYLVPQKD